MFPRKVGSNQAGFSFLDLILLIRDSVDRSTLNYFNKSPPDTPNIPIESLYMNPDLNALLMYKLTLEQKTVLATEISFLMWDRNKATTTYYSARILESREKRKMSPHNRNRIQCDYQALGIDRVFSLASTTDSNDKNLRNILELLKPPDRSFTSKVINFGVVNVHTKI